MFFYRFLWRVADFCLVFRLIPKVSTNFHVEIEEKQPGTFCQGKLRPLKIKCFEIL